MHTVELLIGDQLHSGFHGGSLTRSMRAPASSFQLAYSATATERPTWPIEAGDLAELRIDGTTVITGFVDSSEVSYSATERTYRAAGRSKVGDLVDSSCMFTPRTWRQKSLASIAANVAEGFACDVEVYGDSGRVLERFRYQPGEAALEVIRRAAALRGMFLFDAPSGNLVVDRVGADTAGVTLGPPGTVLEGSRAEDWSQRYSEYHFRGQSHARDDLTGKAGTQLRGEASDPTLQARDRFRPFVVSKRGGGGRQDLGAVAIMTRNKNAGASETVRYKVPGWNDGNGEVWRTGYLVDVDDSALRVRGRMVVVSATLRFGPLEPWVTDLELAWPEAFDDVDFPTRGRGDVWT